MSKKIDNIIILFFNLDIIFYIQNNFSISRIENTINKLVLSIFSVIGSLPTNISSQPSTILLLLYV